MATLFTDDFNRADEALTVSPNWKPRFGGTLDTLNIVSNVVSTSADNGRALVDGIAFPADQWAEATVLSRDADAAVLYLRHNDSNDNYSCFYGASGLQIAKFVGGSFQTLASGGVSNSSTSHTVRFEVQGTLLKGFVDGVELASVNDSALTSGDVGFSLSLGTTRVDSFSAGDLIPPPSVTITQTELTPGGTISGSYSNYATVPTTLTVSDGTNTITIASPTINDNGDGTGTFSGTMPALPTSGTANLILFGNVTVELS